MTDTPKNATEWVFRIFNRRPIIVKAKNVQVRKLSAVDPATNLPFGIEIPEDLSLENIKLEKTYFASLNVYTARNVQGLTPDFVEFFEVLDVDQTAEDFIRVYWAYPKYIRFELLELEPFE